MPIIPDKLGTNPLHRMRNRYASQLLEEQWTVNYKVNKKYLDRCVPFSSLSCTDDSLIAVVVGAGPSLKQNLEDLKYFPSRDRLVFFSTDKAFLRLYGVGILPDFVMALNAKTPNVENEKETSYWWKHGNTVSSTLIMPITADPYTLDGWKGDCCIINGALPLDLTDTIERETGLNPMPTGTNVGAFAYLMACRLGYQKVVLMGMDYSFNTREEVFSDGHGGARYPPGEPYIIIEHRDQLGRVRWTEWGWFDSAIAIFEYARFYGRNGVRTINCTEGGIVYDGEYVESMTMREAGNAL